MWLPLFPPLRHAENGGVHDNDPYSIARAVS